MPVFLRKTRGGINSYAAPALTMLGTFSAQTPTHYFVVQQFALTAGALLPCALGSPFPLSVMSVDFPSVLQSFSNSSAVCRKLCSRRNQALLARLFFRIASLAISKNCATPRAFLFPILRPSFAMLFIVKFSRLHATELTTRKPGSRRAGLVHVVPCLSGLGCANLRVPSMSLLQHLPGSAPHQMFFSRKL